MYEKRDALLRFTSSRLGLAHHLPRRLHGRAQRLERDAALGGEVRPLRGAQAGEVRHRQHALLAQRLAELDALVCDSSAPAASSTLPTAAAARDEIAGEADAVVVPGKHKRRKTSVSYTHLTLPTTPYV